MTDPLPHRVLSFYGDDFTGSTDVMEVAALAGLSPVLFVDTPDEAALETYADARVVGIAGIARSQGPAWMRACLPPVFRLLQSVGAPLVHYKVCSTFDSAPEVGNIGCAAEIGLEVFGNRPVPVLVGAPALRRYLAFGNLFASLQNDTYRIDRHPVMSRHPVTPMADGDLRRHLAKQTHLTTALIDLPQLESLDLACDRSHATATDADLLLVDTVDARSLQKAGLLVWSLCGDAPIFAVGSSGLEYALVAAWRSLNLLPDAPEPPAITPIDRIVVVSGSASSVTAGQIEHALAHGFSGIWIDPLDVINNAAKSERLVRQSLDILAEGHDALLYTALGPDSVPAVDNDRSGFNDAVGAALGRILHCVLERSGLQRAVVAGGDTSSHAVGQLGLQALRFAAPLAPGSPVCRAFGRDSSVNGIELALKGGQIGREDFFTRAKGSNA